jgi:hypothetical protein
MQDSAVDVHLHVWRDDVGVVRLNDSSFKDLFDGNVCATSQDLGETASVGRVQVLNKYKG